MTSRWPQPPRIVVLTGPALSREAGFAPFDPAQMPPGVGIADFVTSEAFARDPAPVHAFYNERRRQLLETVTQNAVHDGLAALDIVRRNDVLIVTRNIDDLHERAGSQFVIHTHGELLKARCLICTHVSDRFDDISDTTACPICGNAGHLRPHIVWVGEEPLRMAMVYEAVAQCRQFLVIGAAVSTEPWAGLLNDAKRAGARTVECNPTASPSSSPFDESFTGPLTETVPEYVKRLIAEA
jgi:NAD-dependent deacetylase